MFIESVVQFRRRIEHLSNTDAKCGQLVFFRLEYEPVFGFLQWIKLGWPNKLFPVVGFPLEVAR